ncbi:hypothetical protein BWQ96_04374 [Gracilariopsis chorda]|uniref:Peptidase M10 metallopeptidase domain-containing protein n=1 Tax=Gracilariopsis chorda TaxID=448386 RepID=A0A2V3IVV0_9FLOR|nr:hypothetical protein BWQ96_04374 [Gracilariopsis chorda]|eukprot:PXF45837.1 hypothetical protein BWQ96_04374 [Gracilariopsis chorda]
MRCALLSALLLTVLQPVFAVFAASIPDTHFATTLMSAGNASTFKVDVYGVQNNSQLFAPLQHAFDLLADAWTSQVLVNTRVVFTQLGPSHALATGGGVLFVRFDASPHRELVPIAAAEAITNADLNAHLSGLDRYDVLVKVNKATPWHLDIHSQPPHNQYDLITVLLHEVYHNLLFSGAVSLHTSTPNAPHAFLLDGYPARFDLFLANAQNCAVLDYLKDNQLSANTNTTNGQLLAEAVTNRHLYFHDPTSGVRVPLYAPESYAAKSSIYHIDASHHHEISIMNHLISAGFQHRVISNQILQMQAALLNPENPGANHCPFPLSDPVPHRTSFSSKLAPPDAVGNVPTSSRGDASRDGPYHVPRWAIIAACGVGALACVSLTLAIFAAVARHVKIRNGLSSQGMMHGRTASVASSQEMLVDHEFTVDHVICDVGDVQIDAYDFRVVQGTPPRS